MIKNLIIKYFQVPRINYDYYNGLTYRYFYAICSDVDHPMPGTVSTHNGDAELRRNWLTPTMKY